MNIMEITIGKSYGCKFKAKNIPLDEFGRPGGLLSLTDLPIAKYGDYEGFGFLTQRDVDQQLVVVEDEASGKEFVCDFDNIWDVAEVDDE